MCFDYDFDESAKCLYYHVDYFIRYSPIVYSLILCSLSLVLSGMQMVLDLALAKYP